MTTLFRILSAPLFWTARLLQLRVIDAGDGTDILFDESEILAQLHFGRD